MKFLLYANNNTWITLETNIQVEQKCKLLFRSFRIVSEILDHVACNYFIKSCCCSTYRTFDINIYSVIEKFELIVIIISHRCSAESRTDAEAGSVAYV
jgi:hypothetical protein